MPFAICQQSQHISCLMIKREASGEKRCMVQVWQRESLSYYTANKSVWDYTEPCLLEWDKQGQGDLKWWIRDTRYSPPLVPRSSSACHHIWLLFCSMETNNPSPYSPDRGNAKPIFHGLTFREVASHNHWGFVRELMKQGLVPTVKAALITSHFLPRGFSDLLFGILAEETVPAILM